MKCFPDWEWYNINIFGTDDPNHFWVECDGHGKILFPGYPEGYYENHFLHSFELEDGKIKRNREFMNVFQQLRDLGSTHWPWIGERTRQVDGAHVALLAEVLNPVACKVGPEIGRDQLLALCERLDPRREPGRLTLIARMGAQKVGERLPPLVEAVRAAGHPVIWLSDPMHGNTIVAPCGNKTRLVRSIAEEVAAFRLAVSGSGGVAAGLHLETTPDDVTECVADSSGLHQVSRHYTSLCDPRLNPWQALSAVMAWSGAEAIPSATFPLETVA